MKKSHLKALFAFLVLILFFNNCSINSEPPAEPVYYNVTFDTNGGTSVESQNVEKGKKAERPANPTKSATDTVSYTFANWYSNSSLTTVFDFDTPITEDIILYAKWTESKIYYSVTIANNITGGTVTADKTSVAVGDTVTLTIMPDNDYHLDAITVSGANLSGSGNIRTFIMPACNVTVSAEFSESLPYIFHETVTYLDAEIGGSLGNNKTYVYFGDWPQTVKAADVTVDESQTLVRGAFTYYKGSDKCWYVKSRENGFHGNGSVYYSDKSLVGANGRSSKYFKVEPIKWCVLTDDYDHDNDSSTPGKKILLAETILTAGIYNVKIERALNEIKIYPNNYKYSNIRSYLNGISNQYVADGGTASQYDKDWTGKGFIQNAFTVSAQDLIAETRVDNSVDGSQYACENTKDKIFLISQKEVTNPNYISTRSRYPTDYAKANSAYKDGYWWLRTPINKDSNFAYWIYSNGSVMNNDDYLYYSTIGIVPALCLE